MPKQNNPAREQWEADWEADRERLNYLISRAVGFPAQVDVLRDSPVSYGLIGRTGDAYEALLHPGYIVNNLDDAQTELQREANDFYQWYSEEPKWFATPLEAAQSFVEAWEEYCKDH